MPKYQQGDKQVSDGVNLLISILVRYPEVGTISYNSTNQSIKLTFMLAGLPDDKQIDCIVKHITQSLSVYHLLKNVKQSLLTISMNRHEPMSILTIIRDVHSLTRGEIALIISLLRDKVVDLLVTDASEFLVEEDLLIQEELIESMLENMKQKYDHHSLIGIREDGRVLVFNK